MEDFRQIDSECEDDKQQCQKIPRHQLHNVRAGDEFSANGFDWKCIGVDSKYVYAKPEL